MDLSKEERAEARLLFQAQDGSNRVCSMCGGVHARACARIREYELYENGNLKRIHFWGDQDWDDSHVIWPEQAFADAEDEEPAEEEPVEQ